MKKEIADKLSREYEYFWRDNLRVLPDGWLDPLLDLFDKLYRLSAIDAKSDGALIPVDLYVEAKSTRAFAFAAPTLPSRWWTDGRRKALIDALADFQSQTMTTCQVCGKLGTMTLICRGDLRDGIFCDEHNPQYPVVDASKAGAEALYQELRDLFPPVHGKTINFDLPDYLVEPVATALRVILKSVVREGIVGKVLITRLEFDGDCLFVRVRYYDGLTDDHLGTKMSINSMVADLETQADELVRKHGGSDAASS